MKKGGFLRNVLDTIRSNQQTNQQGSSPGSSSHLGPGRGLDQFGGQLKGQHLSLSLVARHGFPEQPSALAFDPVQKIAAIGTKTGALRVFGRPGVDVWAQHKPEFAVTHIKFIVNQGALITVTSDESIHLWSLRGPNLKLQLSATSNSSSPASQTSPASAAGGGTVSGAATSSLNSSLSPASVSPLMTAAQNLDSGAQPGDPDYLADDGQASSSPTDKSRYQCSKQPEILHTLKFQREHITCLHQTLLSKWLYIGTERGNVHVANVETFELSGYSIAWNKAIELSRKTHPGSIIHISECPQDSNKLLIGYESGCIALWDLKQRNADGRYYNTENLLWLAWHHEGKQFVAAHGDGSLVTWQTRSNARPSQILYPHAKTQGSAELQQQAAGQTSFESSTSTAGHQQSSSAYHQFAGGMNPREQQQSAFARAFNNELYRPINKIEWKTSKSNEQFLLFSGGLPYDGLAEQQQLAVETGTCPSAAQRSSASPSAGQNNQFLKSSGSSPLVPTSPSVSPSFLPTIPRQSSLAGQQQAAVSYSKERKSLRSTSLTVMYGKSITVLEMDDTIIDFITICDNSPWENDTSDPFAVIILLSNDLILIDLTSSGYPSFESPYPSATLNESPVTCVQYLADCSSDLIPFLYSTSQNVVSRAPKKGFSDKEWPINGGEWGQSMQSYPELVISGHADGTIKFWDMSGVNFDLISKIKTTKLFERPRKLPNSIIIQAATASSSPSNSANNNNNNNNNNRRSTLKPSNVLAGGGSGQTSASEAASAAAAAELSCSAPLSAVTGPGAAAGGSPSLTGTSEGAAEENFFAIERIEYNATSKHLLVAGAFGQVIQFKLNKREPNQTGSGGPAGEVATILVEPPGGSSPSGATGAAAGATSQQLLFKARLPLSSALSSSSGGSSSSSSSQRNRSSGFQAELICLTPMLVRPLMRTCEAPSAQPTNVGQQHHEPMASLCCQAPPKVTALAFQERHNILAYSHELGIVLVDTVQKCVIVSASLADLYGGGLASQRDVSIQPFATSSILQHHYQQAAAAAGAPLSSSAAVASLGGQQQNNGQTGAASVAPGDNGAAGKLLLRSADGAPANERQQDNGANDNGHHQQPQAHEAGIQGASGSNGGFQPADWAQAFTGRRATQGGERTAAAGAAASSFARQSAFDLAACPPATAQQRQQVNSAGQQQRQHQAARRRRSGDAQDSPTSEPEQQQQQTQANKLQATSGGMSGSISSGGGTGNVLLLSTSPHQHAAGSQNGKGMNSSRATNAPSSPHSTPSRPNVAPPRSGATATAIASLCNFPSSSPLAWPPNHAARPPDRPLMAPKPATQSYRCQLARQQQRQEPQAPQSRFTTNSMFQRQLSTTALGTPPARPSSALPASSGPPRPFQRQATASQLLGGGGGADGMSGKQRAAALLAAVRTDQLTSARSASNLAAAGRSPARSPARPLGSEQPAGGTPTSSPASGEQQPKKAGKNKRIISRMLSISAIHTSSDSSSSGGQWHGTNGAATGNHQASSGTAGGEHLAGSGGSAGSQAVGAQAADGILGVLSDQVADKFIDSSFTRSRSSSASSSAPGQSLEVGTAQAFAGQSILCLCFLDWSRAAGAQLQAAAAATSAELQQQQQQHIQPRTASSAASNKSPSSLDQSANNNQLALWLGTSHGAVLLLSLTMPDNEDNRVLQLQSVQAEPIPQAAVKLSGPILCLAAFTCEPLRHLAAGAGAQPGSSPPGGSSHASLDACDSSGGAQAQSQSGRLQQQQQQQQQVAEDQSRATATFLVVVSEKQAKVFQVPFDNQQHGQSTHKGHHHYHLHHHHHDSESEGQSAMARFLVNKANCVAKEKLSDSSYARRAALVGWRQPPANEHSLVTYLANGSLMVHSLPQLRQLLDTDFVPYTKARIAASMCLSRQGHGLYQPSASEISKFTLSAHYGALVNEMTGSLYVPREMPEMPRANFFKSLFSVTGARSATAKQSDRDELFGECSAGRPTRGVAKHIASEGAASSGSTCAPGGLEKLKGAAAGSMGYEVRMAREGLDERGEKLSEMEDKTLQMLNQSESYAQAAHKLAERFKDKKWYQF